MKNSTQSLEDAVALVSSSDQFKVLSLLKKPELIEKGGDWKKSDNQIICVIADCEATSADPATAAPIELGMLKIVFSITGSKNDNDHDDGSIEFELIDSISILNDPGIASEPGAFAAHGISQEEIAGHSFDQAKINEFLEGVEFVIAHNARYDRPVLSRHIPKLAEMPWSCTFKEIPWGEMGISARSLEHLLFKAGHFHSGHRALEDCYALLKVVTHPYLGECAPLVALNHFRSLSTWVILCDNAPFDKKDLMRVRGYKWNAGDGSIPYKVWSSPEISGDADLLTEFLWLTQNVYPSDAAKITSIPVDASIRYADNQASQSYAKRRSFTIASAVAKLRTNLADKTDKDEHGAQS